MGGISLVSGPVPVVVLVVGAVAGLMLLALPRRHPRVTALVALVFAAATFLG